MTNLDSPELYINRELSLLEFQRRVLEEAEDATLPLLERIKFLAIVGSNLDEFFMVRVGGLKMQIEAGVVELSIDGKTPAEQLAQIRKVVTDLMVAQRNCLADLLPRLDQHGIHLLEYNRITPAQTAQARKYFEEVIFPVLTPLAFDPGHPFPHISNLSLNLAVLIEGEDRQQHFARIKVPDTLPRLVPLKRSSGATRRDGTPPNHHYFIWLEQVIAANLDMLFPGMKILEVHPFRVTRNADMVIQELEAMDLLETMEQSVRQRRFGDVIRLSINTSMPEYIRDILVENLEMDPSDVYVFDGPLGLSNLMALYSIDRYDLKDPPFVPAIPHLLQNEMFDGNLFKIIREHNGILLHHPYDSFAPVVNFLKLAGSDPNVLAIKQTLYRVGRNSPVVRALMQAQENRKQVAVLVELKARFDEESNISWAKMLEREGVHVTYGLVGLKTHCKIALVVRKEGETIRRYVHLSTGNYNAVTAHTYEDIGMFTSDPEIGADITDLFNFLTGYSAKRDYRKLLIAPINLRQRLTEMIHREIEHQKNGTGGHIIIKTNAVVDKQMIQELYRASQAGVKIQMLVRGICCLRPGVPGISENITVSSIVGRFLEHSRVYYFHNAGQPQIYLGSADLMPRNINRRVEVLFPVEDPSLISHLHDNILQIYLNDNLKTRRMNPDGTYRRIQPQPGQLPLESQAHLLAQRLAPNKKIKTIQTEKRSKKKT
ncbi:MAG: polyphosphate kinase 1 [Anaerolineales bacterium]